ncbi:gas vesicle protein K [Streptomyces coffeae]|uniref:Gas vesicle protein K n=1 Tax=Streptomyces coffeae TaxID=621382 RepID=A0ABS1NJK4_9ACTN|nr:gas vesicle protein K [Streptomyces coffeae]MBL1100253.1 gas vesicle protein K [Streptomyces coffeae]
MATDPTPTHGGRPDLPGRANRLGPSGEVPRRIEVDKESARQSLAGLVLTIVELLRQLMERQALRRIDQGGLSDEQIEKLGLTLMALEENMTELREHFGLTEEDLNLDLGPLGPLLPRD